MSSNIVDDKNQIFLFFSLLLRNSIFHYFSSFHILVGTLTSVPGKIIVEYRRFSIVSYRQISSSSGNRALAYILCYGNVCLYHTAHYDMGDSVC